MITGSDTDFFASGRAKMVAQQLRRRGITDPGVLRAMGEVPREQFLPPEHADVAYEDRAVPLARGQTVSQPYMVAAMTQALALRPDDRVLEIGTGSGYQTAVLSRIAGDVFTVERIPELAERAQALLDAIPCAPIRFRVGDGSLGWPEESPFDAVLVTAGAPVAPASLKEQLHPDGGRLVIPVGPQSLQKLVRFTRTGNEITAETLMSCRFVPLLGSEGW